MRGQLDFVKPRPTLCSPLCRSAITLAPTPKRAHVCASACGCVRALQNVRLAPGPVRPAPRATRRDELRRYDHVGLMWLAYDALDLPGLTSQIMRRPNVSEDWTNSETEVQ